MIEVRAGMHDSEDLAQLSLHRLMHRTQPAKRSRWCPCADIDRADGCQVGSDYRNGMLLVPIKIEEAEP